MIIQKLITLLKVLTCLQMNMVIPSIRPTVECPNTSEGIGAYTKVAIEKIRVGRRNKKKYLHIKVGIGMFCLSLRPIRVTKNQSNILFYFIKNRK